MSQYCRVMTHVIAIFMTHDSLTHLTGEVLTNYVSLVATSLPTFTCYYY